MEIFSEKNVIQKILVREKFVRPPNSAPGLRHCFYILFLETAPDLEQM